MVNPNSVVDCLTGKMDEEAVDYIHQVNLNSFPKIKELKDETEIRVAIHKSEQYGVKYPQVLMKSGLPQGLPWSPLLCSLVLDKIGFDDENVIMYADDGLIFYKGENKILDEISRKEGFVKSCVEFN